MACDVIKVAGEIRELLQHNKTAELEAYLERLHPSDLAQVVEEFEPETGARLLALAGIEDAAHALDNLGGTSQRAMLDTLTPHQIGPILGEMPDDDVADLVGELSPEAGRKVLSMLDREDARDVKELLTYPDDSAGGHMTTEFVWVSETQTAAEAIERIRQLAPDAETVNYIYVLDAEQKVGGVLSLRDIILARPEQQVSEFMERDIVSVRVDQDQEEVARAAMHYDLLALPVVDGRGRMLGIVTIDDLVDVIDEEAAEDLHGVMVGGAAPERRDGMAVSAWTRAKQRLPWLIGLMFGDFLAAGVIENFSAVLETVVALAFFIPVLLDMGGNVGTQSLALTVRGLATGECSRRDVWRMVWRESRVGIMLGTACGAIIGVVAGLWQKQPLLGLVVGLTMFATLSLAAVLGIVVPMIMDKLGVDPAIAASPFITSVADVSGLLIYFVVARFLLIRVV